MQDLDTDRMVTFRRELHRHPELSGEERGTAIRSSITDSVCKTIADIRDPPMSGYIGSHLSFVNIKLLIWFVNNNNILNTFLSVSDDNPRMPFHQNK